MRLVSHGGRTAWGEGPGPAGPIYFSISWGGESTHRTQRRMYCFPVYRCLLLRPAVPAVPSVPQACRFSQEAFPHASPPQPHRACVCVCVSVSPFSLSRCPPCSSFRGRKGGPSLARSPLPLRANMCPEPCLSPDAWFEAVGAVCVHEPGTQRFTKGLDDLITWTETTPKCDRGQLDILFRILRLGGELKVREEIFPLYLFVLQMYARLDLRQHEWADFIIYDHLELLDTALVLAWRMEKARGASPAEFAIANMDCIGVVCDKYPFMELSSGRRFERLLAIHFMERACSESHLGDEMWRDTLSDLLEMHQSGQGTSVSAFV